MATTTQQPQSWKDAAIAKSEAITDTWEVTKSYAGRLAEWILFLCMIINIVEMLPGVTLSGWITNTVLGVQVVMLDVGGFSLASMADHARENGNAEAARKASITGWFLIGLMIVTLLLVASGVLFPQIKPYTDDAEKGLILIRVIMTVVYGHVIHSLRHIPVDTLTPVQVATVETRLHAQVTHIEESLTRASSQLVTSVQQEVASQVAREVATVSTFPVAQDSQLSEQVATLITLVTEQAKTIQHLTSSLAEVRREVRTTVTEIRSISQETPPFPRIAGPVIDVAGEPSARVSAFLMAWRSPEKPTLQTIMDTCQVAKKTAAKYRDLYYGSATSSQMNEEE